MHYAVTNTSFNSLEPKNIKSATRNLESLPYFCRPKFYVMNPAVLFVHEQLTGTKEFPKFKPGDNITVNYKIIEGTKERIQSFKGDVLNFFINASVVVKVPGSKKKRELLFNPYNNIYRIFKRKPKASAFYFLKLYLMIGSCSFSD